MRGVCSTPRIVPQETSISSWLNRLPPPSKILCNIAGIEADLLSGIPDSHTSLDMLGCLHGLAITCHYLLNARELLG